MDVRRYKKYLNEVCDIYGINAIEAEALFKTAIARAYNTFGSAYIWEDGTISLAVGQEDKILLKNYIISAKQYIKITKHFTILLEKHAYKRDTLFWVGKLKGSIISVKVLEKSGDMYIVKPCLEVGALDGYPFVLPLNKAFRDGFKEGSTIDVVCKGFSRKMKKVIVYQEDEAVALFAFEACFQKAIKVLGKFYAYKSLNVAINLKTKNIVFNIHWSIKPSATVISFLTKELNEKLGRCIITCKGIRRSNEAA